MPTNTVERRSQHGLQGLEGRRGMFSRLTACAVATVLSGCSAINDVDFRFVDGATPAMPGARGDAASMDGGMSGEAVDGGTTPIPQMRDTGPDGQASNPEAGTPGEGGPDTAMEGGRDATQDVVAPPECTTEGDCTENRICRDGACVFECAQTEDCEAPKLCIERRCVFECEADDDCLPTYACVGNLCQPPDRESTGIWSSAGGGLRESENFKLRVSVGAPQPMSNAASESYRIQVGPSAGRP